MLWDRGTWTPEVDDVDAALKKGDLKLTLNGYKLKGSWVLVRTKGRWGGTSGGGDRSWLLIKHRDEWAGSMDITEFAPLSVKSGGDFADILAQDNPDIWLSHRPAQGGEAGEMFERIVARALEMRSRDRPRPTHRSGQRSAVTPAKRVTKTATEERRSPSLAKNRARKPHAKRQLRARATHGCGRTHRSPMRVGRRGRARGTTRPLPGATSEER